jgi:hypothetical protein
MFYKVSSLKAVLRSHDYEYDDVCEQFVLPRNGEVGAATELVYFRPGQALFMQVTTGAADCLNLSSPQLVLRHPLLVSLLPPIVCHR